MLNTKRWILVVLVVCSILGGPVRATDQIALEPQLETLPETCTPIVAGLFAVSEVDGKGPHTAQGITFPSVLPDSRVAPVYPEAARKTGVSAKVQVRGIVCRDGSVQGVEILKAPSAELGMAAADALRRWRFNPAVKDGKPVAVAYTVSLEVKP